MTVKTVVWQAETTIAACCQKAAMHLLFSRTCFGRVRGPPLRPLFCFFPQGILASTLSFKLTCADSHRFGVVAQAGERGSCARNIRASIEGPQQQPRSVTQAGVTDLRAVWVGRARTSAPTAGAVAGGQSPACPPSWPQAWQQASWELLHPWHPLLCSP